MIRHGGNMKKIENRLLAAIVFGIVTGSLCALLDLVPGDNIWTVSSFSGTLGFWAISGMLVVMLYDKAWKASLGTFLYFAFMNTSFFIVHFMISTLLRFPRISRLSDAFVQSAIWLIPSAICGLCALIAHLAKKNNMVGVIALSLPIGLLIHEFIALLLSVIINHNYLFQTVVDALGIILLWKMYSNEKNKIKLATVSCAIAGLLIVFKLVVEGTILYF